MNHVSEVSVPVSEPENLTANMACIKCGVRGTTVYDSRGVKDASRIRRRRKCLTCGFRFSTQETATPEYTGEIDRAAVAEKIARAEKSVAWLQSLLIELRRELGAR